MFLLSVFFFSAAALILLWMLLLSLIRFYTLFPGLMWLAALLILGAIAAKFVP